MQIPPSISKLVKTFFLKELGLKEWASLLESGNLYTYEQKVHSFILALYDKISAVLIGWISRRKSMEEKARALAKRKGLKKLVFRPVKLQLRTGTKVESGSWYAKKVSKDYEGSRHTSILFWSCTKKSSPMYQSLTGLLSILCPSFELSKWLQKYQGIKTSFDRTRAVALGLGKACMSDRVGVQLTSGESLKDKRVVISLDGGRTRTRVYQGQGKANRGDKFDTPWQEPKLFVITTIDSKGQISKAQLPIYDSSFGAEQTFDLLSAYLKNLQISEAKSVQFIADGAPWIWNRAKQMLLNLGVEAPKIVETLDYYHAMEHAHDLKVYVKKGQKDAFFKAFKQALWEGDIVKMSRVVIRGIPNVNLEEFTPFQYFVKNKNRIDYQSFRAKHLPLGSGIVESGIRRVINLRFKSPSSFWYPENVEKLIFMRGVALSGRWEIMMQNLTASQN